MALVSNRELLVIEATIECRVTLKRVRVMITIYSHSIKKCNQPKN